MNVLERTDTPGTFRVDPGLLALGIQLLDVPIAHETILAARTVLMEHTRSAAHALARLFKDEVWSPYRERESDPEHVRAMKSLSAHMQPMVVQALVTTFQRSLKEELRGGVRRGVTGARAPARGTPAPAGGHASPNVSPRSAFSTSSAGGVKRSPYVAASSRARATKPGRPPSYPLMYWIAPPVQAGKPMPMMEPMLASATDVSTPSSKQRTVSSASEKSIRSFMSVKGISAPGFVKCSRRPGHRRVRFPSSPYS